METDSHGWIGRAGSLLAIHRSPLPAAVPDGEVRRARSDAPCLWWMCFNPCLSVSICG